MIVVADASVLVGELLRKRGRELLLRPELQVHVAEDQWGETQHELSRRLGIMESSGVCRRTTGWHWRRRYRD
jgi:hypothetical protein